MNKPMLHGQGHGYLCLLLVYPMFALELLIFLIFFSPDSLVRLLDMLSFHIAHTRTFEEFFWNYLRSILEVYLLNKGMAPW